MEIYRNKSGIVKYVIFILIFAILILYSQWRLQNGIPVYRPGVLGMLPWLAAFCMMFLSVVIIGYIFQLLAKIPIVVFDEEGIVFRKILVMSDRYAWRDIKKISTDRAKISFQIRQDSFRDREITIRNVDIPEDTMNLIRARVEDSRRRCGW